MESAGIADRALVLSSFLGYGALLLGGIMMR